eukprot:11202612-Lingulodinium_polyedra.AAC.1
MALSLALSWRPKTAPTWPPRSNAAVQNTASEQHRRNAATALMSFWRCVGVVLLLLWLLRGPPRCRYGVAPP